MPLSDKISNIIGVELPEWVKEQLIKRSDMGSLDTRDNSNIVYLQNKTAWVRLVSSINIAQDDMAYFRGLNPNLSISQPEDLAKEFVLFGGTSKYLKKNSYELRSGILGNNSSYSPLGEKEINAYGYRPMPGITKVSIQTQGRLGSVRMATINFKCWDKSQLDVMDTLYFKLGFSMFLEWGNVCYYDNVTNELKWTEFESIDPFEKGLTKEDLNVKIYNANRSTYGNYDAMLGMTTNYDFNFSADGGFDCTIKLIGLGILADSVKINNTGAYPTALANEIADYNVERSKERVETQIKQSQTGGSINVGSLTADELVRSLEGAKLIKPNSYSYPSSAPSTPDPSQANVRVEFKKVQEGQTPQQLLIRRFNGLVPFGGEIAKNQLKIDRNIFTNALRSAKIDLSKDKWGTAQIDDYSSNLETYKKNGRDYSIEIQEGSSGAGDITNQLTAKIVTPTDDLYKEIVPVDYENYTQSVNNYIKNYNSRTQDKKQQLKNITSLAFRDANRNNSSLYLKNQNFEGSTDSWKKNWSKILGIEENLINSDQMRGVFADAFLNFDRSFDIPYGYKLSYSGGAPVFEVDFRAYFLFPNVSFWISGDPVEGAFKINQEDAIKAPLLMYVPLNLKFTDTDIIREIVSSEAIQPTDSTISPSENAESAPIENASGQQSNANTGVPGSDQEQNTDPLKSISALESVLRTIQLHSYTKVNKDDSEKPVTQVDLTKEDFHKTIFSQGLYGKYIQDIIDKKYSVGNYRKGTEEEKFKIRAAYGFAYNLMAGRAEIEDLQFVNYNSDKGLLTSYVVNYDMMNSTKILDISINKPVYISLGTLLMAINGVGSIFDVEGKVKTPMFYIDYNPNHSFCLTTPKHLSVDPWTVLIPFEGTAGDYEKIFPESIIKKSKEGSPVIWDEENKQGIYLFRPEAKGQQTNGDKISESLPNFKCEDEIYRGKIMNVLLNIDYVCDLINSESIKDDQNVVSLRYFIEQILLDINKKTGNFNSFRLAYDDQANCMYIVDDQIIPVAQREKALSNDSQKNDLRLFGKKSIAKSINVKTEISSRLSNMIAISANADYKKSAIGIDGESVGFINQKFRDRYIPERVDENTANEKTDQGNTNAGLVQAAIDFNRAVKRIYATLSPTKDSVPVATNFYMERIAVVRGLEPSTNATMMIPVAIDFSTDGISGMAMGHSFTVQKEILPYTYTTDRKLPGENPSINRVGFVITGLNHDIDQNVWTTSVKANMIFLKNKSKYTSTGESAPVDTNLDPNFSEVIYNTPWSAMFISYIMKNAGINFPFNRSTGLGQNHNMYLNEVINNPNKYDVRVIDPSKNNRPQKGDIVIYSRENTESTVRSLDRFKQISNKLNYPSHADIIINVQINPERSVNTYTAIGGNLSDSVSYGIYKERVDAQRVNQIISSTSNTPIFAILRPAKNVDKIVELVKAEFALWNPKGRNKIKENEKAAREIIRKYYEPFGYQIPAWK